MLEEQLVAYRSRHRWWTKIFSRQRDRRL